VGRGEIGKYRRRVGQYVGRGGKGKRVRGLVKSEVREGGFDARERKIAEMRGHGGKSKVGR